MTLTDVPTTSAVRFSPRRPRGAADPFFPKLVAGLLDELLETRRRQ